jgi:hypothetical protein
MKRRRARFGGPPGAARPQPFSMCTAISGSSVRFLTGRLLVARRPLAASGEFLQFLSAIRGGAVSEQRSERPSSTKTIAPRQGSSRMRPPTPGLQGPADLVGRTGDLLAKPEACKRSGERGHRAASSLGPWGHGQITRYMDRRALARLRGRVGCNRRLGRPRPEHYNTRHCDEPSSSPLQSWGGGQFFCCDLD